MTKALTLGSLFDGIGGFPLAGIYAGMNPVWASEIEPFPIRVTAMRLPQMKHYGDIHALNGAELEPVDVITFGSPCQNLSIAGKRTGLSGEQSSLFFEAIRIITEMRKNTNDQYPRYVVWENVPGALSSANGGDFREVLAALIGICERKAIVPMPENGRWLPAGEIMGNTYSLAWRILDAAQGWGVAQRRKRIFVVLDLAGQRAGKILFESEGMSRYTPPRFETRKGAAECAERSLGASGEYVLNDQGGARMDVSHEQINTLRAKADGHAPVVLSAGFCTEHSADSRSIGYEEERSPTLRAGVTPGIAIEYNPTDSRIKLKEDGICQTLTARCGTGGNTVPLTLKIRSGCDGGGKGALWQENKSATLACNNDQTLFQPIAYGISSDQSNAMLSDNPHAGVYEASTSRTLDTGGGSPSCNQGGIAIVESYSLQGNMIGRKDENGPLGSGINKEVSFTLDATDRHGVCAIERKPDSPAYCMTTGSFQCITTEKAPTLEARNFKDAPVIGTSENSQMYASYTSYAFDRAFFNAGENAKFDMNIHEEVVPTIVAKGPSAVGNAPRDDDSAVYKVRRLTPLECCRLQGYPDGWTENLGTENPSDDEITYWTNVFWDYYKAIGKTTRPPNRNRIVKWLKDPRSDAAEYKAYGNSVAVPCVFFVLAGIAWAEENSKEETT